MIRSVFVVLSCVACASFLWVNAAAQTNQSLYTIDKPTAGVLPDAAYQVRGRTGPESSFLLNFRLGFRDRVQLGASFGMRRLFDNDSPQFNNQIGLQARWRIVNEGRLPALAIGFDSQGVGAYHDERALERYDRKSLGFYLALSKNYALALGDLSLHGGVSVSTERRDDDDPNPFVGAEWILFERLSFLLDADAGFNDNADNSPFGHGGAYVDGAVRWFFGERIVMTLIFRDLTDNFGDSSRVSREFEFAFVEFF